ncbi:flagellar type III secretion system pore protein FliP [Ruminococcaceae bacterium OttesenSCG-928-L11]|nr:flagellar type III secretion system pore protein FliP [Ruminococcaceae bacterium OttesenSCG-928-L11]
MKRKVWSIVLLLLFVVGVVVLMAAPASAAVTSPGVATSDSADVGGGPGTVDPNIQININGGGSDAVRVLLLLTILTLLPSILLMMTCFTRFIVTFSLLRNAIGLQQTPPNQVLIGLALMLTLFVMQPVLTEINADAYQPFSEGDISSEEFLERAQVPLKDFMLKQIREDDLNLFVEISKAEIQEDVHDYAMTTIIPAFVTSELKRAFTWGFYLFIPFLIIDMVVSSALMSMGMMMLPPMTISLPFKLMLFVLVDGWGLLIKSMVMGYTL